MGDVMRNIPQQRQFVVRVEGNDGANVEYLTIDCLEYTVSRMDIT